MVTSPIRGEHLKAIAFGLLDMHIVQATVCRCFDPAASEEGPEVRAVFGGVRIRLGDGTEGFALVTRAAEEAAGAATTSGVMAMAGASVEPTGGETSGAASCGLRTVMACADGAAVASFVISPRRR